MDTPLDVPMLMAAPTALTTDRPAPSYPGPAFEQAVAREGLGGLGDYLCAVNEDAGREDPRCTWAASSNADGALPQSPGPVGRGHLRAAVGSTQVKTGASLEVRGVRYEAWESARARMLCALRMVQQRASMLGEVERQRARAQSVNTYMLVTCCPRACVPLNGHLAFLPQHSLVSDSVNPFTTSLRREGG